MQLEESLTKENFWNELYEKFPKGTQVFCNWIDEYKKAVNWDELFAPRVKFHDVPYEMQMGIWIAFLKDRDEPDFIIEPVVVLDLREHIWPYIVSIDDEIRKKEYYDSLTPEERKAIDEELPF